MKYYITNGQLGSDNEYLREYSRLYYVIRWINRSNIKNDRWNIFTYSNIYDESSYKKVCSVLKY